MCIRRVAAFHRHEESYVGQVLNSQCNEQNFFISLFFFFEKITIFELSFLDNNGHRKYGKNEKKSFKRNTLYSLMEEKF